MKTGTGETSELENPVRTREPRNGSRQGNRFGWYLLETLKRYEVEIQRNKW
jgi:hypothetical protein